MGRIGLLIYGLIGFINELINIMKQYLIVNFYLTIAQKWSITNNYLPWINNLQVDTDGLIQ